MWCKVCQLLLYWGMHHFPFINTLFSEIHIWLIWRSKSSISDVNIITNSGMTCNHIDLKSHPFGWVNNEQEIRLPLEEKKSWIRAHQRTLFVRWKNSCLNPIKQSTYDSHDSLGATKHLLHVVRYVPWEPCFTYLMECGLCNYSIRGVVGAHKVHGNVSLYHSTWTSRDYLTHMHMWRLSLICKSGFKLTVQGWHRYSKEYFVTLLRSTVAFFVRTECSLYLYSGRKHYSTECYNLAEGIPFYSFWCFEICQIFTNLAYKC